MITEEMFNEWRQSPVGKWFFDTYLEQTRASFKQRWLQESWETGETNQSYLENLKMGQHVLGQTIGAEYDGIVENMEEYAKKGVMQ